MRVFLARHWPLLTGSCWFIAVALLTLQPASARWVPAPVGWQTCLICGYGGTADAILNVVLFLPLGLAMGAAGRTRAFAWLSGLAISMTIEVVQLTLPGRWGGIADVLWNSTGAVTGVLLYGLMRAHVGGRVPRAGRLWSLGTAATLLATGVALVPDHSEGEYWGQWTVDLGAMPVYEGRVVSARLNGLPMPSGRLGAPMPHRLLLDERWSLEGQVVVGPPPPGVSPILSIHTVHDGEMREVLLLGAHRNDLVFRERTVARTLRLDAPDLRLPGAFASLEPGDTVAVGVRREGGLCLRIGSDERCELGVSAARGWGLLLYLEGPSESLRGALDFLWLALMFFVPGLLARSSREALENGLTCGLGIALGVALTPMVLGAWFTYLACPLGLGAGFVGRVAVRRLQLEADSIASV